ncbi:sensor domain-containing protein [Nocardia sp. IFM 10818]
MRGRGIAGVVALLFLVTGCGKVVSGSATPDPIVAKMPRLTPDKIADVMLTPDELGKVVAATGLKLQFENTVPTAPNFTYQPSHCGPMLYTGNSDTYGDKWTGYRLRSLQEGPEEYDHAIYQTVTTFKNFVIAEDLVAEYREVLSKCKDTDVKTTPKDAKEQPSTLRVTAVPHNSDPSAISVDWTVSSDGTTWVCSDTIRTQGNAVIEVSSCSYADARTSAVIADRIATKIRGL